ncbi:ABC transporter ATP-binding protein [Candidatus Sumerlaeota bacterium]|nr:ABC transporter ATP-binding protein [Candidatus Sumerlaeota bacterium]
MAEVRKSKSFKERWQTIRRALPDAMAIARPQAGLWAMGLVLVLVSRIAGLALPAAPKFLIDQVIPNRDLEMLYKLIAVILGATIIQGASTYVLTQTISKTGQRLITELRMKIYNHVSRLPVRYFDNRKTGEVVSRVMNDVEGVRNLVGTGMVELLGGLLGAGFALAILFYINWKMTLAIMFFLVVVGGVLVKAFMVMRPIFKERQRVNADVTGRLTESIGGVRVVKAYNTEDVERKVFNTGVDSLLNLVLRTINAVSAIALTSSVLIGILGSVILIIGGRQLLSGAMSTGDFISYLLYLGFMISPISAIVMMGSQFSEIFAGLERMKEVLSEPTEDANEAEKTALGAVEGIIRFEDVDFEYEAGKPVLKGVTLEARPGMVTALVGPSGSGKSTLIGLVAAFHHPTSGRVTIDGHDVKSVRLHDYRRQLGAVLQENFLFDGTVRENILYARPGATDAEMREAARLAYCDEFIEKFPNGFDTIIGERGVKLSGGQRQRVAIARALLANPKILILDEATSALDSESEASIQQGLATLMKGRTTFVIAHRLSTVRNATQILVVQDGEIIERGTHQDLIAAHGRYFEMYTRQHGLHENLFVCEDEVCEEPADEKKARSTTRPDLSKVMTGEL